MGLTTVNTYMYVLPCIVIRRYDKAISIINNTIKQIRV